jgi:hypothetical protein
VDLVQVTGAGTKAKDGLDAIQAVPVYEHFKKELRAAK